MLLFEYELHHKKINEKIDQNQCADDLFYDNYSMTCHPALINSVYRVDSCTFIGYAVKLSVACLYERAKRFTSIRSVKIKFPGKRMNSRIELKNRPAVIYSTLKGHAVEHSITGLN